MAGIGQSSTPSSDLSNPWNSPFSMGRPTNIDNYSVPSKNFPVNDKRRPPEENGISTQNMYSYRQPTGFQSSNIMTNDKSYLPNIQTSLLNPLSTGNSAINYNMYSRTTGNDSNTYQYGNLDMSSQSKHGFNSSARFGPMSQYMESSSQSYLTSTPHRTISGGSLNPNVQCFNGQSISKNRPGSYNFDNHSLSLNNQYETQWDNSEFPSLKAKPGNQQSQFSSNTNYNYNFPTKTMGQINYQMVTKSGMPIMASEPTSEFSIQQEDFPALPLAQNPVTSADLQRSSSDSDTTVVNSCDNSSQSLNSSIVDTSDLVVQKSYSSNCILDRPVEQGPLMMSLQSQLSSSTSILSSIHSSFHLPNKVQRKISKGPNNYIANIPNDMVSDAFGLIGLVKLLGINDTYDNLNLLAPGVETLALNKELDSTKDIYHSYASPLSSNCAGRPHDMDYPVPKEYRIRHIIMDKLAEPLPDRMTDETLFWIFYNLTGEECQLTAARHLINRQWRYNKREKFWLTREPGVVEPVTHPSFERGNYIVWEHEKMKKVSRALTVYYKDLGNIGGPISTKLLFPFCHGSMKGPTSSSSMMMSGGRYGGIVSNRPNKSRWAAPYVPLKQQSLAAVGASLLSTMSAVTVTNNSDCLVSSSQMTRPFINGSHPQQQQHLHMMTMPSCSSPTTAITATTSISTTPTSTVTASQQ